MSEACFCTTWYAKSLYRRSIKQQLWFVNVRNFVSVHIIGPIVRMKNLSSMRKRTWDLIGYISQLQFIVIFVEIYWPFFMKFLNNAPILSAGQQKVREHGSGALRKWQTKLRKWYKVGKRKKKENKKRKKGRKRSKEKRGKEKEEEEVKKRKDYED